MLLHGPSRAIKARCWEGLNLLDLICKGCRHLSDELLFQQPKQILSSLALVREGPGGYLDADDLAEIHSPQSNMPKRQGPVRVQVVCKRLSSATLTCAISVLSENPRHTVGACIRNQV